MGLRDDLDAAADVADILSYQQRADMLEAQKAQLATLRELRDQTQVQAIEAKREKALQDTLFALRRTLPTIAGAFEESPHKAAADLILAEQTLQLVPPEAFSSLEWKELSLKVADELKAIMVRLEQRYGEPMVNELVELREAARILAAEERARSSRAKREREEALRRREEHERLESAICTTILVIIVIGLLVLVLGLAQ
jgi:hypothetical protein